jgi:putative SOS response-associated peptidase YedK
MCGRFYLDVYKDELSAFFGLNGAPDIKPRYNIAPSQEILAIVATDTGRAARLFRWGLIPFWAKDEKIGYHTINARVETVAAKPAFRAAFKSRRCLIPASGFYEWKTELSGKQPYCIRPKNAPLFALAGLYEHWEKAQQGCIIDSCSIIVGEATESIAQIHDRMPLTLNQDEFETWLDPDQHNLSLLKKLMVTSKKPLLKYYPVTKKVGHPSYDQADAIQPIA